MTGPPLRDRSRRALVYACLFLSGASPLVYEVAWMRQLRLTIGATTAAVSTVLAVYMGGLTLGALVFGRIADRSRDAAEAVRLSRGRRRPLSPDDS